MENECTWWHHYALLPQPYIPLNVALATVTAVFVTAQVRRDSPWSRGPYGPPDVL